MPFSQSSISSVVLYRSGPELYVCWFSNSAPRTIFQVYVDHRLTWFGSSRSCHVPVPYGCEGRNVWVEVGTVDPYEPGSDYSSSLVAPGGGGDRAQLCWFGGSFLDSSGEDDVQGFRIYRSAIPDGTIDLTMVIDILPAYPGGWISDGFGMGGFGQGGFGRSASYYQWVSSPLPSGNWLFSVVPFDKAGNEQNSNQTVNVTIRSAPLPPALSADGSRLTYTYSGPTSRQVTVTWLASPSVVG
jgi:hypothetical protein